MDLASNLSSPLKREKKVTRVLDRKAQARYRTSSLLKRGIWLYFFLLIFEGALRKWVLPDLSTPLLIVRDPVAIWLLYTAFTSGVFKLNGYVVVVWVVSIIAFIMTLLIGHGSLTVAVYGLRITLLHFPLIFLIGKVFDREEVVRLGYWLLWIAIGMTVLLAIQFYSPQSAWVNRGVGGDLEGSGFSGAAGYYRVPGTFSFTNGLSFFYGLATAYIFYFWLSDAQREVPRLLLVVATICLLVAIPLSISRTLFFEVGLSFLFVGLIAGQRPKFLGRLISVTLLGGVIILVLGNFDFFQTGVLAFTERFTTASKAEGGLEGTLLDRFAGGMLGAITDSDVPFWGLGIGMGTNAGSQLLTGKTVFLISEGEWGRLIGEMGLMFGMMIIITRVFLVLDFFRQSWFDARNHNYLPWLLLSFAALIVLQGQWTQPTALGFSVVAGGLVLASLTSHNPSSKGGGISNRRVHGNSKVSAASPGK